MRYRDTEPGVCPSWLTVRSEVLTTARLLLEPLEVAHAAEMVSVLADPELHRYTGGAPLSREELEGRYERQARGRSDDGSERWFNWIIRVRDTDIAVGYVQATIDVASGAANLAWVIGRPFQRRGHASEAAVAMVAWLRRNGVATVTALVHPDHEASGAVAKAIGLTPTSNLVHGEVEWH